MTMSWGRRATAAALDIGRRFKGRKTSSSFSSSACAFPSAAQLGASAPATAPGHAPATATAAGSLQFGKAADLIPIGDAIVAREAREKEDGRMTPGNDNGMTAPALLQVGRQRGE
jgi:3-oxoacyl-(acyl-carrier-protein) synthase